MARIIPVKPPKEKENKKPITKNKGVIKKKQPDHKVTNQFNILIPVGMAIIEVAVVK